MEILYQFEKKLSKSDLLERKRMSKKKQLLVVQLSLIPSIEEERPGFLLIFFGNFSYDKMFKKNKDKIFRPELCWDIKKWANNCENYLAKKRRQKF